MLYIMRHGTTDWNLLQKLQGQTDIPLNEKGAEMARAIKNECSEIGFDVCYCSPLIRARKTAELALEGLGVPIIPDARLKEMCFGIYEGFENYLGHPETPMYTFFSAPQNYTPPKGAESFDELFARTGEFLNEIIYPALSENKKILIVGHGAMNCSIICQIRNTPLEDFWKAGIPNCKLIKII